MNFIAMTTYNSIYYTYLYRLFLILKGCRYFIFKLKVKTVKLKFFIMLKNIQYISIEKKI